MSKFVTGDITGLKSPPLAIWSPMQRNMVAKFEQAKYEML